MTRNLFLFAGSRRSDAPADPFMPCVPCGLYTLRVPDGTAEEIKVRRTRDTSKRNPGRFLISVKIGESDQDHEDEAEIRRDGTIKFLRARPEPAMRELVEIFFLIALGLEPPDVCHAVMPGEYGEYVLRLTRPACARCGRTLKTEEMADGISAGCARKWRIQ